MSKKKKIRIALALILILVVVGLAASHNLIRIIFSNLFSGKETLDESAEWNGGETYEFVSYAQDSKAQYLHLYVPDSEKAAPLFILVHGGGFYFNDNESRQAQFMYRYFRDHGYACASINYRLGDEAGYPAALEDVKAAVRFLRANAETYGYDAEKFAIWGESAGGYLAVMTGVTNDEEFGGVRYIGEDISSKERVSAEVQVIVDFYGAVELGEKEHGFQELGIPKIMLTLSGMWLRPALEESGFDNVESAWLRRDMAEMPEAEKEKINPAYYIEKNLDGDSQKKVIIRHGDADLDVPYLHSERIARKFAETIGEENVSLQIEHNYKHASDQFYSDAYLEKILREMDSYFGRD